MKFMTKRVVSVLICIVMLGTLFGCAKNTSNNSDDSYLELVDSPSTTLDNVWYNPGGIFRCALFESLLIPNADMTEFEYALAKKYTISEDELVYTFTLRDGVRWHDGEAFDASDVLFSMKAALRCKKLHGIFSSMFQYIEGATEYAEGESDELSGIQIDGDHISFHLTQKTGGFLNAIAQFAILPEHLLGDVDPTQISEDDFWKSPVGCGCYKVVQTVENEYFMLQANNEYYGSKAGIKNIKLNVKVEDSVQAMKDGKLDFYITNDPEEIAELKGIENCSEHQLNILFPAYLIMNLSNDEGVNEQLKDVRVRKALLLAIDRDTIVDAIFPGSSVTDTLVPAWDAWYWEDAEKYEFNPEEAKRLLSEANFDYSQTIRLRYSTKGQSTSDLMDAIATYWRAIGISVDVAKFEGSGSEHMFNVRDYDVCYKRLSAFNYGSIYEEVHGDGIMQTSLYNQPVYDEWLNQLEMTIDADKRKEMIGQMQMLDQQYLLRVPLFTLANVAYVNDTHFHMPDAYGNLWYRYDLQFEDWKLVK